MPSLITVERAIENPTLAAARTAAPEYFSDLLDAASQAIENYCKRSFAKTSYRLYLSGSGIPGNTVILPNTPVVSIDRIATRPMGALTIQNTLGDVQLARVSTADDGTGATASITLSATASAVTTTNTLTVAANPTLLAMAVAINALGNGWNAIAASGYALWPVAELRPLQGAASAIGAGSTLAIYTEDMPLGSWTSGWGVWSGPDTSSESWRLDAEAGIIYGWFPPGLSNLRIDYTGGYATIPPAIAEACVMVTQTMWQTLNRDPNVIGEKVGPYSQQFTRDPAKMLDNSVKQMLEPYVSHSNLMAVR